MGKGAIMARRDPYTGEWLDQGANWAGARQPPSQPRSLLQPPAPPSQPAAPAADQSAPDSGASWEPPPDQGAAGD